jgi:hypothetical protein
MGCCYGTTDSTAVTQGTFKPLISEQISFFLGIKTIILLVLEFDWARGTECVTNQDKKNGG